MNKKSNEEVLNFWKSFELLLLDDDKFARDLAENRGYNPVEEGRSVKDFVSKFIIKEKASMQRSSLSETFTRAGNALKKISQAAESDIKNLQTLFDEKLASKYALNFRELKEMDPEEAIKILTDIEILEILEKEYGTKDDDSKK